MDEIRTVRMPRRFKVVLQVNASLLETLPSYSVIRSLKVQVSTMNVRYSEEITHRRKKVKMCASVK